MENPMKHNATRRLRPAVTANIAASKRLLALLLVSVSGIAGCAADAGAVADNSTEESTDDLSAAGKALIGSYNGDSGVFQSLVLTSRKVGTRNAFVADVDTGVRCVRAPCPSGGHIEGTFTAGAKTITLYSTTASGLAQPLLGKYSYVVQGATLLLSRNDFAQSLEKAAEH
jgi:hypothetical protein